MFSLLFLGINFLAYVAADPPAYQASPSIAANASIIISAANRVFSKHSSHDISGTYFLGIGSKQKASIYKQWPVRSLFSSF